MNSPELKILAVGALVVTFPGVADPQVGDAMLASGLIAPVGGFVAPAGEDVVALVPAVAVDGDAVLMKLAEVAAR